MRANDVSQLVARCQKGFHGVSCGWKKQTTTQFTSPVCRRESIKRRFGSLSAVYGGEQQVAYFSVVLVVVVVIISLISSNEKFKSLGI